MKGREAAGAVDPAVAGPRAGMARLHQDAASSPVAACSTTCKVDVPLVLANLSLKLGRSIRFDPATEKIVGDEEAARLAKPNTASRGSSRRSICKV